MNSSAPSLRQRLYATCGETGYVQCHIAFWIWKTIPIGLLAFGTVGNILSLVVLMRKKLRQSSTTVFFVCLAISDLTVTWHGPFRNMLIWVKQFEILTLSPFHCKMQEAIAHTAGGTSIWMLVLLTMERVISVVFPMVARMSIKRKHTTIAAVSAFVINALVNCHFILWKELQWKSVEQKLNNTGNETASSDTASLVKVCAPTNDVYAHFLTKWWSGIVLIAYNIVPFTLILSGNATIALTLWRRRRNMPTSSSQRSEQMQSVTKLVFWLSGFFLLCVSPYCVFHVMFQAQDESLSGEGIAWLQLFLAMALMLLLSNYTFNFCFYFLTGSTFRLELYALMSEINAYFRRNQITNSGINNPDLT